MSPFPPSPPNFSMSISSLAPSTTSSTNSTTTSISKKSNVKYSHEYRTLRQQLFNLQSSHANLKLQRERENISSAGKRGQFEEEIKNLKEEIDELKKDQVFILNSEKEAIENFEKLKRERDEERNLFQSQWKDLEGSLQKERDLRYKIEAEMTKLKLITSEADAHFNNINFDDILKEWKDRVIDLSHRNNLLETELESLKQKSITPAVNDDSSASDPEMLRQKILSTYVSLESAQAVLLQKRAEADRLAQRIGNVKVLEERYRDALIRIKRLEGNTNTSATSESSRAQSPPANHIALNSSNSASDLKLVQLTQEIGILKETLALTSLNVSSLKCELDQAKSENNQVKSELEETKRNLQKVQNNLKVKESTISSLKEQLDSTVNLLTETLKKKKQN